MWIYLFNIITIPIYSRLIKDRKKFIILVALQLFLILALRSVTLGVDLSNYSAGYEYIGKLSFEEMTSRLGPMGMSKLIYPFDYENGYTIMNWLSSQIGFSFHGFLVICAAINIGTISAFIYKYSKKPWLSFVIFSAFGFYAYSFGIIRQSLALSFVLLSYMCLDKKKYFFAILYFVMAFLCHRSAVVAIIPLILMWRRSVTITKKRFALLLFFSLPVMLFSNVIYNDVIVKVMSFMGKGYAGHDFTMNNMLLLLFGISLVMMIFCNFSKIKDKMPTVSCYALILAVYFSICGLYNDNFARALQFLSVFLVILIPEVFDQYKGQKAAFVIEVIVYLLLFGFMCYDISGSAIDPYILNCEGFLW